MIRRFFQQMRCSTSATEQHRAFKLIFVPILIFSLLSQLAVVWAQLEYIRDGYMDFPLYYGAAKIIHDGKGVQLYDLEVQKIYQQRFRVADLDVDLPFNHLPYELLLLLMPANFSFPVAHALWAAMNILLLALILFRLFPFVDVRHRFVFALMLFAYFPTIMALKMGQDSVITTVLLVETFVNLKRKHYAMAGGCLALGLYKPQFVLPLVGILFLQGRWISVLSFAFTGVVLGAVSLAMVGWDGLNGLLSLWLPMIQRGHVVWPERMSNLRGLVYIILDAGGLATATNVLTVGVSLLVYFVTCRLWSRASEQHSELFDLGFALAVVMTALVSFHMYSYDGTMLVISLIIMLSQVLKQPRPYTMERRVFLATVIALFIPLLPNALLAAAVLAWWALPSLVLFGVIAIEIGRRCQIGVKVEELTGVDGHAGLNANRESW